VTSRTAFVTVPSRVAVSFAPVGPAGEGRTAGEGPAGRVTAPGRVLRLWSMLNAARGEVRSADLTPPARARLQRTLRGVSAELGTCVSPVLAAEFSGLLDRGGVGPGAAGPGAAGLGAAGLGAAGLATAGPEAAGPSAPVPGGPVPGGPVPSVPGADELRIEYALVLGWLGGLVIGMLDELETAAREESRLSREVIAQAQPPR
jgi:hypothetical protein